MSAGYDDDRDDRADDYDDSPRGRLAPHRGTLILVLGIVGLVACPPVGIAAWMMGKTDLAAIRAGRMDPAGKDTTQIGYILGIVAAIIFALQLVFLCVWLAFFGAMMNRAPAPGPVPPAPAPVR